MSVDGFLEDDNYKPESLSTLSTVTNRWTRAERYSVAGVLRRTRPYWDQIEATIVRCHVFDLTDGWDGNLRAGSTSCSS